MSKLVTIGGHKVGRGEPVYIIGEIGINHNGDLDIAKRLISAAAHAGCTAVKFQKRTPELAVPPEQRNVMRETPWGLMTYMDYRYRVEFGEKEYAEIERHCKEMEIDWFVSVWDTEAINFMERFNPVCYKLPSASLTDFELIRACVAAGRPLILSSGMSTMEQIHAGMALVDPDNTVLCHSTSTYPCSPEELNLRMIETLSREFDCPIGYSGHETGLVTTVSAVVLGACLVERHITLDRAMWGSDQAASVEPGGLERLVKYIRVTEQAMGDGVKRVYESEMKGMKRLRKG